MRRPYGRPRHASSHADDEPRRGRPAVVIVGAGFGGLEAASRLRGAPVDVTVVDRCNHHVFQPLLYQVATAVLSPADIAWPIRSILNHQRNVTVLMDEVTHIDTDNSRVHCADHPPLTYDHLIMATGARHAYFGNDDWEPHAPGLKDIDDATGIRRRILLAFERAEKAGDPAGQARLLTFVVVGGGPTGVEMAGALAELAYRALVRDFRRIDPQRARIILVEAGDRILPSFPASLSRYAAHALERLGVEIRLGRPVTACDGGGVRIGDKPLPAGTVIWGAGVRASPVAQWLDVGADRAGRVRVDSTLAVPAHPAIHVIGDAAATRDANARDVPGTAPAAKQQGRYVARCIIAAARGRRPPGPFRYRDYGNLATIGRHAAVVDLGWLHLRGAPAWWFWGLTHIYFLIGVRAPLLVAMEWLWSYITFGKGARLITGARGTRAEQVRD